MNNKRLDKHVKAFSMGKEDAFDIIYEETKTVVYYTVLSVLKDESLSEDIMQETYIRMIKSLDQYKYDAGFRAWMKTIAKNLALNEYKRRQKTNHVDQMDNEYLFESVDDNSETKYYLNQLLHSLPDDEKEIVVRHTIYEETHKVIAQSMNIPLGTVLWKYQKALKALKRKDGVS